MPTFGSLFAGIGGIDLGLERAGWTCRWQVEIDEFCQRVLERHWPDVPRYGDVAEVDWSAVEPVDLIAGGFPCQPSSNAGKRRAQADERWLWPEFARAVRALRPRYVLVENVAALLVRGFDDVIADLAALRYDAEWDCIPAATVGAPHRRDRLWLVAHAEGERCRPGPGPRPMAGARQPGGRGRRSAPLANAVGARLEGPERRLVAAPRRWRSDPDAAGPDRRPAQSAVGRSADGLPGGLDGHRWPAPPGEPQHEWEPPRTVEPRLVANRNARLEALGNAVVPQLVEHIGRRILEVMEP